MDSELSVNQITSATLNWWTAWLSQYTTQVYQVSSTWKTHWLPKIRVKQECCIVCHINFNANPTEEINGALGVGNPHYS